MRHNVKKHYLNSDMILFCGRALPVSRDYFEDAGCIYLHMHGTRALILYFLG